MIEFTDKSRHRYQIVRELGHNRAGGRVTFLSNDTMTGKLVVIKQFQFGKPSASWSGFKAYEIEAQILKNLKHPGIPFYLNSFETSKSFCLVQEYKNALSLAIIRTYSLAELKQIAISILDILIYLQSKNPPIIHRDVKPENILIDDNLSLYLVDFGFAKFGGSRSTTNSTAAGTFGFMAPEQIYNRQLTNATDLYGLGATLICLVTGTKSTDIGKLIDEEGRFNFKHLVSDIEPNLITWLEKMVQLNPKDRYPSAATAKVALLQSMILKTTAYTQIESSAVKTKSKNSSLNFSQSLPVTDYESQLSNLTEEQITLALTRRGNPAWKEKDFEKLLYTLGCAGYGWLEFEGVRQQLLAMWRKRLYL